MTKPKQRPNEESGEYRARLEGWHARHAETMRRYAKTDRFKTTRSVYKRTPEVRARAATRFMERYRTDAEFREKAVRDSVARNAARRKTDPQFRLSENMRSRLNQAFKSARTRKHDRSFTLIGCTIFELVAHIESLLRPGMKMSNYGEWVIDHIRPVCSFDLTDPDQARACFHYTNLQPLWWEENVAKSVEDALLSVRNPSPALRKDR